MGQVQESVAEVFDEIDPPFRKAVHQMQTDLHTATVLRVDREFKHDYEVIPGIMQQFEGGATRNVDIHKHDYEAFLNPEVLYAYGEFMHAHRRQRDGTLRDGDNWQKGIPFKAYAKSLVRHTFDLWRMHRGFTVTNPDTGQPHTKQELCCAIMFNVMGYLKELLAPSPINVEGK